DYRNINKNDGDNNALINALCNYYNQCDGLPSIDSFKGAILSGRDCVFYDRNNFLIRCTTYACFEWNDFISIELGKIVSFRATYNIQNIFANMSTIRLKIIKPKHFIMLNKIGLYVRNDAKF